ncbi:MAG: hypothetical protein HY282_13260 [Nitrospirae bacterium]|nr:hypothetical protein [Candidatus Manganitrophaceae bacterium]
MRGMARSLGLMLFLATALVDCAHQGDLHGQLTSPAQANTAVIMHFKSDRSGHGGMLWTTLPNGESFSGTYVQITSTTEERAVSPYWAGWPPYWTDWGPYGGPWINAPDFTAFRTNYSNRVVATLFGNPGDTMRCRFDLKNPPKGLSGGGTGECQTSKGEKIDVQF